MEQHCLKTLRDAAAVAGFSLGWCDSTAAYARRQGQ